MNEIIRMINVHLTLAEGDKYYQAVIGIGFPVDGIFRILHRKWDTYSEAQKYLIDFFSKWYRLHKEIWGLDMGHEEISSDKGETIELEGDL